MILREVRAIIASMPPHVVRAAVLLVTIGITGTAGYMVLEGWSFLDALYMTVIVLTTIGFREVRELDDSGRIFTIALAVVGVGAILYALLAVFQFIVEGELASIVGVHRMKSQIERLRDHYILCGFGRVGEEIAREFESRDLPFVIIETNAEAIERAQKRGYLILVGDGTSDEHLREGGVEHARCLLAASDSDSGNTFIVLTAKALNPRIFVVARAARPETRARLERAGADRVFSPYIIAGRQMAVSALQPLVFEFIDTLQAAQEGGPVLAEIDISVESGLAGVTIEELLRPCKTVVVLGLRKLSGEIVVDPEPKSTLEAGDRVIVIGSESELESVRPTKLSAKA